MNKIHLLSNKFDLIVKKYLFYTHIIHIYAIQTPDIVQEIDAKNGLINGIWTIHKISKFSF